jgi:hypothetical protein
MRLALGKALELELGKAEAMKAAEMAPIMLVRPAAMTMVWEAQVMLAARLAPKILAWDTTEMNEDPIYGRQWGPNIFHVKRTRRILLLPMMGEKLGGKSDGGDMGIEKVV